MIRHLTPIALILLSACACASAVSLSDRLAGADRVRGDEAGVHVFGMASRLEALPLAVGHCAKFHRAARFTRRIPNGHVFACVPG